MFTRRISWPGSFAMKFTIICIALIGKFELIAIAEETDDSGGGYGYCTLVDEDGNPIGARITCNARGDTGSPVPVAMDAQLQATTLDNLSLPGIWSYVSNVPGGHGFSVDGSEYYFIDNTSVPNAPVYGSTFHSIMDSLGNTNLFVGVYTNKQPLSPRMWGKAFADGGKKELTYDERGNVELVTVTGTDDTSTITFEKDFDATCSNILTCNQPNWVKDAKGNQTDFEYSSVHGGVLKKTGPADRNGVRPQTRYEYAQFEARYKNSAGQIVASGQPIWLLVKEEYCISTAATTGGDCQGGAQDEVVTEYDYGPTSGANNLALRGMTVTAYSYQDAAFDTLRTCYYYDDFGNQIAETNPRADLQSCY